jgi:hypothetical protein
MPTYEDFNLYLNSIAWQMKKVCPPVHDYQECEEFVKKLRSGIDPILQRIYIQLIRVDEKRTKKRTKKSPDRETWVYIRSLYDLTRGWGEEWVRMLTQLKEEDDFVDILLQSIFSGPWQQENPRRIVVDRVVDIQINQRHQIVTSSYLNISVGPLREETHTPPPGSVYIPPEILETLLQTVKNPTNYVYINSLTYFERKWIFRDARRLAYGPDLHVGGIFEEQLMGLPEIMVEVRNNKGGTYYNSIDALRVFSCSEFGEQKQKQLFLEWKKNSTKEELHRLLTLIFHKRGERCPTS